VSGAAEELTFEQALARLDEVVARMDGGDVGLEEAVRLFEQGQELLGVCRERLALAQQRITELTAQGENDVDAAGAPF
jgi:exodeoxyribonuclease VII small subunit